MISLSKHIECLLVEHDCVIVPGFGGFFTNTTFSQVGHDADVVQILPPNRVVGFNQALKNNDGLLASSYMQTYDAVYPAAYKQMIQDIDDMMNQLKQNGSYSLEGLGALELNLEGRITFLPSAQQMLTPRFYALPLLEIKSLAAVMKEEELKLALATTTSMPVVGESVRPSLISPNTRSRYQRWIDLTISAAAAVVLFCGISYPVLKQDNTPDTIKAASVAITTKPAGEPQEKLNITNIAPSSKAVVNDVQSEKTVNSNEAVKHQFTIVLSAGVRQDNAEEYIKYMSKQGFAEAKYYTQGKKTFVIYSSYSDKNAANAALLELRKQHKDFELSWVLEYSE